MTTERPKIVLFGHGGKEHLIDYGKYKEGADFHSFNLEQALNEKYIPWNDGAHYRKFMKAYGQCIGSLNAEPKGADITFWGEWEPGTRFREIIYKSARDDSDVVSKIRNSNLPHYMHEVYTHRIERGHYLQNTDPCVFGKNFYYTNCKQEGEMKKLKAGDIILFGTSGRGNSGCKYMELDTVFVVADRIRITKKDDYPQLNKFCGEEYDYFKNAVLEKIFERIDRKVNNYFVTDEEKELIVYKGATYNDRIKFNGIYSFVPCMRYKEDLEQCSFGKVILTERDFGKFLYVRLSSQNTPTYNNKVNGEKIPSLDCYKKYIGSDEDDNTIMKRFWKLIASTVIEQGCYLGISVKEPVIETR